MIQSCPGKLFKYMVPEIKEHNPPLVADIIEQRASRYRKLARGLMKEQRAKEEEPIWLISGARVTTRNSSGATLPEPIAFENVEQPLVAAAAAAIRARAVSL